MALGPCRRLCRPGRLLALVLLLMVLPLLLLIRPEDDEDGAIRIVGSQQRQDWFSVRLAEDQREYIDTKGVHVVVGHYMGEPAISSANLTDEILNSNGFAPVPHEGRDGQPVLIPPHLSGRMQTLFRINRFNLMASDRIPLNRSLPDVRKKRCRSKKYPGNLPTASVIIVFHNEAWSTLLRTVWSVINRSPRSVLKEILLIDDASSRTFLGEPLDRYVATLPVPVRVLRADKRTGLVRARVLGASAAMGEVLVFLDAHCECTKGWLEPLLARVAEDRTRVVCPVIDILSDDTLAYVRSFELHWGAFNWELHFRWYTMGGSELRTRKDTTVPFKTPTMAGGLFAMDRKFFFELGSYDEQMEIWGGENLELSFRVWQCGGAVEIAPCSHVGHLFRKSSPYSFPGGVGGVLYGNLARVAMVWMDDWANFYFKFNPDAAAIRDKVNVTDRLALRERLQCRGFEWYLDNVWPEHFMPKDDRFFGKVRNEKSGQCLLKPTGRGSLNQPAGAGATTACASEDNADAMLLQMWVHTPEGALATDESVCLDAGPARLGPARTGSADDEPVKARVVACSGSKRQRWRYDDQTKQLRHELTELCLQVSPSEEDINESDVLIISKCDDSSSEQKWIFDEVDWK